LKKKRPHFTSKRIANETIRAVSTHITTGARFFNPGMLHVGGSSKTRATGQRTSIALKREKRKKTGTVPKEGGRFLI